MTFFPNLTSLEMGDCELIGTVTLRSVGSAMEYGGIGNWIEAEIERTLKEGNKLTVITKIRVEEAVIGPKAKAAPTIVRGSRTTRPISTADTVFTLSSIRRV